MRRRSRRDHISQGFTEYGPLFDARTNEYEKIFQNSGGRVSEHRDN